MKYMLVVITLGFISLKLGVDLHTYFTSLVEAREAAISAALS